MEQHPLLEELLGICAANEVEPAKAYAAFGAYQELSLVRAFSDLKYFFNEELKIFYMTGKESGYDHENVYIPVMCNDEVTLPEISRIQELLSPVKKQVYLIIRDRDSSTTCYCITEGLKKPDSPNECKKKREVEGKKYQFAKTVEANRKLFYTKALRQEKGEEALKKQTKETVLKEHSE